MKIPHKKIENINAQGRNSHIKINHDLLLKHGVVFRVLFHMSEHINVIIINLLETSTKVNSVLDLLLTVI